MNQPHDPVRQEFSTEEVRQSVPLHRMRYVLGLGIAGVVVCFILAGYIISRWYW